MLIDRPNVREGSYIQNAVVPSGPTANRPSSPNPGELYFDTDVGAPAGALLTYSNGSWVEVGAVALAAHTANTTLHLTSAQNTLLDGLNPTLTSTELNYVDGVTSNIQTQFNTQTTNLNTEITNRTNADAVLQAQITANDGAFDTHVADLTLHLTAAQNTLLDGLSGTLTATELNYVNGVTSPIQTQLNTQASNLSTHIADASLHLTVSQNTFLDNISVTYQDVNRLAGIDTYLTSVSSANIASYLATLTSAKVAKAGDTMTGNLVMSSGAKVTGLPNPTLDSDAANKAYVDALAGGIDWKQAVKAATTGAITLSGPQTIDGVSVVANDRVLVKDQADPSTNGIYLVAAGAWSRAPDYNSALEISQSAVYVLVGGTTNGRGSFVQTANISSFPGDPITFTPFTGPVINSAGSGINLAPGGAVSVKEGAGITFDGGSNVVVDLRSGGGLMTTVDGTNSSTAGGAQIALTNTGIAPGTYRSLTVDNKGRATAGTNPTTLLGYGITDAQPLDSDLTAIAGLSSTGIIVRTGAGLATTRAIVVGGNGLSVTNGDGLSGNPNISSNATAANTASTIVFRDAGGNFSAGTITANLNGNATSANTATTATTATNNVLKTGDTMSAPLQVGVGGGTQGYALVTNGNAANPGYIAFHTADGTRRGYVGWNSGSNNLLAAENGWGWQFNVTPTVGSSVMWHAGNDGPGSGLNADLLDSRGSWTSGNNWGIVPYTNSSDGVMEIGRHIDFHTTNAGVTDFDARISSGPTSFGSIQVSGATGGYSGIQFPNSSENVTLMTRSSDSLTGFYQVATSTWQFYYDPSITNLRVYDGTANRPVLHQGNFNTFAPTLTGGGASGTWGINITGDAGSVDGYSASTTQVANTIAVRDGSGYTYFGYINSSTGNAENPTISQVIVTNGSDNFYRKASITHLASTIGDQNVNVSGAWQFQSTSTTALGSSPPLQAYSTGAGNGAWMAFHRSGSYAVNMGLDNDNVFRIGGWSAPANRMQLDMSGNVTFAGDVTAFSDARLKTDVEPIYNALNKVLKLRGVTYKRIDTKEYGMGFIAQELKQVVPEVVTQHEDGMHSVAYGNMVAILTEAIKELKAEIDSLKAKLADKESNA